VGIETALHRVMSAPSSDTLGPDDQPGRPPKFAHRLSRYFFSAIQVDAFVEFQLLLLTFSTGAQDAISFPDFRCFASNQTGNTVLLAVGLAGYDGNLFDLPNIGISLAAFIVGALVTGQIGSVTGPRRRAWLLLAGLIQTAMVFAAASVQFVHGAERTGPWALGVIALLAFSSGSQVAGARAMQLPEITTAMATAAWVDLVIDPKVLAVPNRSRDRRALFLVALIAGSFAGAFMRSRIGSPLGLVVSGIGKSLVTAAILVNRRQPDEQDETLAVSDSSAIFKRTLFGTWQFKIAWEDPFKE
jgi:uncharacterized membrane protein YoaK (UPF0700 family)